MAVFRIEKTRDYTVMSNHHLRDMSLSLKAKGLLSLMLSLPENWDYTMKGLARICKDGIDSISGGIRELEEHGYLIRERVRGANGQLGSIEYTILEQPKEPTPAQEKPIRENPVQANPTLVTPVQEEPAQLNKEESSNCYEMTFFNRKSQRTFTCQIVQNAKRHLKGAKTMQISGIGHSVIRGLGTTGQWFSASTTVYPRGSPQGRRHSYFVDC